MGEIDGQSEMMDPQKPCFICGGVTMKKVTDDYVRCLNCGHETLIITNKQSFIINDDLRWPEASLKDSLDRFKNRVLARFTVGCPRDHLVDIGSASGKFLYQNSHFYKHATGIEVTKECVAFAKKFFNLKIVTNINEVNLRIDAVTAWHSIEHIPSNDLLLLMNAISLKLNPGGRVIVSVPNADSIQYKLLKTSFAFYDVPNHLHQFTPLSLDLLMERYGLSKIGIVHSLHYNMFGYVQGFLNKLTNTHNYMYYRLKRRSTKPSILSDFINAVFLIICIPMAYIFMFLDIINNKRQGVITVCFEKKKY